MLLSPLETTVDSLPGCSMDGIDSDACQAICYDQLMVTLWYALADMELLNDP